MNLIINIILASITLIIFLPPYLDFCSSCLGLKTDFTKTMVEGINILYNKIFK